MKTEDIKLFHFIVDSGNLTKASERLDLPKSNLSRRLKNLEDELTVDLFHRHQRTMTLSENGRQFYQRTKPLIFELETTIEEMTTESPELSGYLRIQLLPLPGNHKFEDIIFRFMALHPKVHIEIITSADERDLIEHNIDVAFRIGKRLDDSNLIARPLKTVPFGYYASPEYLAKQGGLPQTEQELTQHRFIISRLPNGKLAKQLPLSKGHSFEAKGRLVVNHEALLLHACLEHQGVSYVPAHITQQAVQQGQLVHLLPEMDALTTTGWLVYPTKASLSMAAKALIEFLFEGIEGLTLEDAN
ncbi:LysR family transcriptional regulator [Agarivorans sp. MS3-6]|uniref:LysR family transcriptional regulator n=1 Tax=Agarivorans sp. TSD2052 TaxID=2937286 RepID=UPI00200C93E9|nr:LysR family transcriptional regulator [Agarivorans sp. TSD2052]UPW19467.1 LysR family transcriptional regulator [Agarivorans sp. TSD2052]